jgi:hypothetical protein
MRPLPGFVGGSNAATATIVNAERTVNLYVESREKGTPKAQSWLYATPCLSLVETMTGGVHRGAFVQNGRAFVITGQDFREVYADGTSTSRGTVAVGNDRGSICSNGDGGNQLFIVVGHYGYVYNLTTDTLTLIADADFPQGTAAMGAFLDGYGIVLLDDSATFQISALEDFTDWDALDIAQKSQTSDRVRALICDLDHKVIWLFGEQTVERWWDSGDAAFPFEPVPNSITSMGIASSTGVAAPRGAIVWISDSEKGGRCAYAGVGSSTSPISTKQVAAAWAEYDTVSDCEVFDYDWRGHLFCVFSFPSAGATWVYDLAEQEWHEWMQWDTLTGSYTQHLARTHMYAFEKHLIGSRVDGAFYELRADVFADGEAPVRRLRRSPHLHANGDWVYCSLLQFDCQTGVGLTTGQGSNPQAMLRISRDGGMTYGNERWMSLGAIGAYTTRVRYRNNGRWRDGVIELTVTDPVLVAITNAWAEVEPVG